MRLRLIALTLLTVTAGAASASAAVCDDLLVPEGFVLDCRRVPVEGKVDEEAIVTPADRLATDLARLTVRELDRAQDPEAWDDPDAWLRSRLVVDVGGFAASLRALTADPSSILGSPTARTAAETVIVTLERWGRAALAGCEPVETSGERRDLACRWGLGDVAAMMTQRLLTEGDRRYALAWRSTDPRSLRYLEAIANSFDPA